MLNTRQRQFKKMMKETEHSRHNQNPIYSYRNKRFDSEKPKRRYRYPVLQIGGVVSLLALLWNLYAFSSFLFPWNENNGLLSTDQLEVHQYIQESSEIELALHSNVVSLMEQYNRNSLTDSHIEEVQKELFELQRESETDDGRFQAMKRYLDEQFNLAYQLTNVLKTENSEVKYKELEYIISNQNALRAYKNGILTSLLESEKIPYEQLEDGTISYQYKL